jgi:predicted oxidoreductase
LKYSKIIAGTMSWGSWGRQLGKKEMTSLINHCFENGITAFDHADIYGDYSTEAEFGKAFNVSGIPRDKLQFISKCGIQLIDGVRSNKVGHYDYSSDYIIRSVEASLKHLNTDYLDVILLHRPSPLMHPQDVMEAIAKLREEGKIRAFGVSNFTQSQMDLISKEVPVVINQIECSLTNNTAMFDGTLDNMMSNQIIPMAWSPLGSMFKENNDQTKRIGKQMKSLVEVYNATEDQLLLAWLLKHPSKIHPVIGTSNKERITKASKAVSIDLDLEDWFLMLTASQGHRVP